jgi:hypothetical protein
MAFCASNKRSWFSSLNEMAGLVDIRAKIRKDAGNMHCTK